MATITISIPPFIKIKLSSKEIDEFLQQFTEAVQRLLKSKDTDLIGYYHIIAKHSGKCLDVAGWGQENGVNVQQWDINPHGDNQKWMLVRAEDGYYYILAKHSGKCLDVTEWSQQDGANVYQWTLMAENNDNQKWKLKEAGDDYFYIIAKHSGKYLDVSEWNQQAGANVQQWKPNAPHCNDDNQKWKFQPAK